VLRDGAKSAESSEVYKMGDAHTLQGNTTVLLRTGYGPAPMWIGVSAAPPNGLRAKTRRPWVASSLLSNTHASRPAREVADAAETTAVRSVIDVDIEKPSNKLLALTGQRECRRKNVE
jgi:hypothetical protein